MKLATLLAIILALSHASASSLRANEPKGSRDLMEKKGKDNKKDKKDNKKKDDEKKDDKKDDKKEEADKKPDEKDDVLQKETVQQPSTPVDRTDGLSDPRQPLTGQIVTSSNVPAVPDNNVPNLARCNCLPRAIIFEFDPRLTCTSFFESFTDMRAGIGMRSCQILSVDSSELLDPVPVTGLRVSFLELDEFGTEVSSKTYEVPGLTPGSVLSYSMSGDVRTKTFQVSFIGENADRTIVSSGASVELTDTCSIYPLLKWGDKFGFMKIQRWIAPSAGTCAFV